MYIFLSDKDAKSHSQSYGGSNPYTSFGVASYSKRIKCRYVIRDASLKTLAQVGITNPAATVWELIPYSFVFDWIIPVGGYLESLDALIGVEDLTVQRSTKQIVGIESVGALGTMLGTWETRERFTNTGTLALPPLTYKPSTSLKAVLNGLSLLAQLRM